MFSRNVRQPAQQKATPAQRNASKEANFARWAVKNKYASSIGQGKTYYQQFFARRRNIKAALERFFKRKDVKSKVSDRFLDYFIEVLEGGSD